MILVDTSVLVAWLDLNHPDHQICATALLEWSGQDQLAVSAVTFAELAAGGCTQEAVEENLAHFERLELDFASAWRAGVAFARHTPGKREPRPVLPDFFIRAQAATAGLKHLTNDRRRLASFPDVEFLFPHA